MLREILAVAARAVLEWVLASLLLANGAGFCLIAAAAARLRLGPPCILCARVHRLLCSSSGSASDGRGDLRLLLCDAHLADAAEPRADPHRCDREAATPGFEEADGPDKVSGLETHRVVSIGSEICEQDHDGNGQPPLAADRSSVSTTTSSSEDGGSGPLVSLFELSPIIARPRGGSGAGDDSVDPATTAPELVAVDGDELLTVGQIVSALREQRRELEALRAELASERRAAVEAEERQRQLEEQGELDREAARLAMQLVHESETEKHGLQRQLEAFRVRAQLHQLDDDANAMYGGEGGRREVNGGGDGNNYQSLVDFLPGSVYSSSPDLANLLKLYTEAGNGGRRRQRDDYYGEPAVAVVEEEAEEEVMAVVAVTVTAATESTGSVVGATTTTIAVESLHERSTSNSCHVETVTDQAD